MNALLRAALIASGLAFGSLPALAAPIVWTLADTTFEDGGTAFGSFVYDADTNVYSDIDIATTAGSSQPGASYSTLHPAFLGLLSATQLILVTGVDFSVEQRAVAFLFGAPLTNAGGSVPIVASATTGQNFFEGVCALENCTGVDSASLRRFTGGEAVASAVPEPGTLFVLGLGALGLAAARRRRAD